MSDTQALRDMRRVSICGEELMHLLKLAQASTDSDFRERTLKLAAVKSAEMRAAASRVRARQIASSPASATAPAVDSPKAA